MARPDKRTRLIAKANAARNVKVSRVVAANLANMADIIEEATRFGVDAYGGAATQRELPMLGSRASVSFVHAKRIPSGKNTFARFAQKN